MLVIFISFFCSVTIILIVPVSSTCIQFAIQNGNFSFTLLIFLNLKRFCWLLLYLRTHLPTFSVKKKKKACGEI
jgi:hypothetical protein